MSDVVGRVASRFGLGPPVRDPVQVAGGLSNEMWRLDTDRGAFALKRMVVNADRPSFVENVESAFRIERRAWAAGVPMPEPIPEPSSGRALVRVDGAGFDVPARPWVFAGWVAGAGGWLDNDATHRGHTALGSSEVTATLARLREVHARLDALLTALGQG